MVARRARALRFVLLASQRAGYAAPRPFRAFLLQLRRLVSVVAVAPALIFVTEHLAAEHAALPVRGTAAWRTAWDLGRIARKLRPGAVSVDALAQERLAAQGVVPARARGRVQRESIE